MAKYKTEQEEFWTGEFAAHYMERNKELDLVGSKAALWTKALSRASDIGSVMEYGSNIGLNIQALQSIMPNVQYSAVDINPDVVDEFTRRCGFAPHIGSLLDYQTTERFDLTFCCGVLIHINPDHLSSVYDLLYTTSNKYIVVAEYYNPTPVTVNYRGHADRLFKRDFAGEMLGKYQNLSLVDYGFIYHRDPMFPLDDLTWFLLEKR
ncbi:pseudaminic acid biosynthesis-associated methylase [Salidesulfovibrio brasiliensis]|uniref:pseudaminic acid biosynthesis-associated methylase n=1 Tax=Salidesulfovibrio brasiliensis TaxID=221711 RepID=UPI0006D223F8|nr:pseudaminic acid biosynthesis-associated methylase [Salidesulfovibrio brasiliensis]